MGGHFQPKRPGTFAEMHTLGAFDASGEYVAEIAIAARWSTRVACDLHRCERGPTAGHQGVICLMYADRPY